MHMPDCLSSPIYIRCKLTSNYMLVECRKLSQTTLEFNVIHLPVLINRQLNDSLKVPSAMEKWCILAIINVDILGDVVYIIDSTFN